MTGIQKEVINQIDLLLSRISSISNPESFDKNTPISAIQLILTCLKLESQEYPGTGIWETIYDMTGFQNLGDLRNKLSEMDLDKLFSILGGIEGILFGLKIQVLEAMEKQTDENWENKIEESLLNQLKILRLDGGHLNEQINESIESIKTLNDDTSHDTNNIVQNFSNSFSTLLNKIKFLAHGSNEYTDLTINTTNYLSDFFYNYNKPSYNDYIKRLEESKDENGSIEQRNWTQNCLYDLSIELNKVIEIIDFGIGILNPSYRIEQLEKQVEHKNIEYKELKQSQGFDWARKVAHEVGTPIDKIRTDVGSLKDFLIEKDLFNGSLIDNNDDEKYKVENTIRRITNSSRVIKNIVSGVKEYGKLTTPIKEEIGSNEVQSLIQDQFDNLTGESDDCSIDISFNFDECILFIDKCLMTQVFLNLIKNTLKYGFDSFDGEREIKILLRNDVEKEKTILTYSNSGNPVTCTENDYWEQFKRTDDKKGSGLGMSIVKEIVESHGGTAKLEPESFTSGHTLTLKFPKGTNEKE